MGSAVSCQAQCTGLGGSVARQPSAIPLSRIIAPVPRKKGRRGRKADRTPKDMCVSESRQRRQSSQSRDETTPLDTGEREDQVSSTPGSVSGSSSESESDGEHAVRGGDIPSSASLRRRQQHAQRSAGDAGSSSDSASDEEEPAQPELTLPLTRYYACGATSWTTLARFERLLCEGVRVFEVHCYDPVKPHWRAQLHLLHMYTSIVVSCIPPHSSSSSSTSSSALAAGSQQLGSAARIGSAGPHEGAAKRRGSKDLQDSEFSLQAFLKVVKAVGFFATPYPIILCVRYHGKQEPELARMLRQELGALLFSPRHSAQQFPSPEELHRRIIVFYHRVNPAGGSVPSSIGGGAGGPGSAGKDGPVPPMTRHHSLPMKLELGTAGKETYSMVDISYPLVSYQDLISARPKTRGQRVSAPMPLCGCVVSPAEAQGLQEVFVSSLLSNVFLVLGGVFGPTMRRYVSWQDPYGSLALLSNRFHACLLDWSWLMDDGLGSASPSRRTSFLSQVLSPDPRDGEGDLEVEDMRPGAGSSSDSASASVVAQAGSVPFPSSSASSASASSHAPSEISEEEEMQAEQTFWWVYRAFFAGSGGAGFVERPCEIQESLEDAEARKEAKQSTSSDAAPKLSRELSDLEASPSQTLSVRVLELTRSEGLLYGDGGVAIEGRVFMHKQASKRSSTVAATWADAGEDPVVDYDFTLDFPILLPEMTVLLLLVRDGSEERRVLAHTAIPCARILQGLPFSLALLSPLGAPLPGCSLEVEVTISDSCVSAFERGDEEDGEESIAVVVGRAPRNLRSALMTAEKRSARLTWRKSVSFSEQKPLLRPDDSGIEATPVPSPSTGSASLESQRVRIPKPTALPATFSSAPQILAGGRMIPRPGSMPTFK